MPSFIMSPWQQTSETAAVSISGTIVRTTPSRLCFDVHFTGPINFPTMDEPKREPNLWNNTCLELFIKAASGPAYWEYNIAPNGSWDVFRMAYYRSDQPPKPDLQIQPPVFKWSNGRVTGTLYLSTSLVHEPNLNVSVTAAVAIGATLSYWAVKHCGTKPDFHLADSFVLQARIEN